MPRSPKGRAAARGLDARLRLQQALMPAGDASLKQLRSIKMLIDSNHGIYRGENPGPGKDVHGELGCAVANVEMVRTPKRFAFGVPEQRGSF